ncbi:MAG: hypothetical protein ABI667_09365 [Sphingomicrobium sp.]
MTESSIDDHALDQACKLAKTLSNSLLEKGRTNPEQRHVAAALAMAMGSIVALIDPDQSDRAYLYAGRVEDLASTALQVLAELIQLEGDGYNLSDLNAHLGIAGTIIDVLDGVVATPILSSQVLDCLNDQMHDQLTPFLRLAVRLSDPDKFDGEYVPEAWVQSSASAMGLAAHLSCVITTADAKANEGRATTDLAA